MVAIARCQMMDVMGGITATCPAMPNQVLATVGVLVLTVVACQTPFDAEIQCTYCFYGMYCPIWNVLGALGEVG